MHRLSSYLQSDDPQDYLLFRRDPPGCDANINCMYFVGLRANEANNSYLDVYLSGEADGWVAIGFSETANMVSFRRQKAVVRLQR